MVNPFKVGGSVSPEWLTLLRQHFVLCCGLLQKKNKKQKKKEKKGNLKGFQGWGGVGALLEHSWATVVNPFKATIHALLWPFTM